MTIINYIYIFSLRNGLTRDETSSRKDNFFEKLLKVENSYNIKSLIFDEMKESGVNFLHMYMYIIDYLFIKYYTVCKKDLRPTGSFSLVA